MIKRYSNFIKESYSEELQNSIGEYIELLSLNDEYIKMIVGQSTTDIDPSIKMSNAINTLEISEQKNLLKRIENYLNGIEGENKVSAIIDANDIKGENINEMYGKGILDTFLKCLTALGLKEQMVKSNETPSEYLMIFKSPKLESSSVKSIFNRFKSLKGIDIDYTKNNVNLFFGIKCNMNFEYGYYHDNLIPIGAFKLTNSTLNKIKINPLKSLSIFKKEIVNLTYNDLLLLCKIKIEMEKFSPGKYDSKLAPLVDDKIIEFSYYGVGKWNNGEMEPNDIEVIKNNLKLFLSKNKWSEKVLININCIKFWIKIKIKIK